MDTAYEVYCLADPVFYDTAMRARDDDPDFAPARRPLPDGWRCGRSDDWVMYGPDGAKLPSQGWKIHASACLDNADEILEVIWDYCIAHRIPFKFIRSRELLFLRNMKYANRGLSGKFVTIFPADEAQLETILDDLGPRLEGQPGPYILSDLRVGSGPLYVRYGGFAERYCIGTSGSLEAAIEDGEGRLVPDERGATFQVPPWVKLPECLVPHLEARNSATVDDMPYRVERALHFSNGGGLYAAVDSRTGDQVVLKEARPYAGLAMDQADAVTRLRHEREMQERLTPLGVVPAVRDLFVLGEHHFLVMDYVDGTPLNVLLVQRYPLISVGADDAAIAEFTSWALDVCRRVEAAVAAVHAEGIVLGDLHPSNVLVRPDGEIVLIDLEIASPVEEGRRPSLADPHFIAPPSETGFDIDRYALACLRLFLFMPLTALVRRDAAKAAQLADEIASVFPVPRDFLSEAVRVLTAANARSGADGAAAAPRPPALEPDADGWPRMRESMAQAIVASATPERDDRLFPGDPKQFETGGLDLAFGAAGVLYALHATGAGRYPEHEAWLVERATDPQPGVRLGFWDGLHGVAHALERLGRRDDAIELLDICTSELRGKLDHFGLDLFGGLAGIGLNLAHFARRTGDAGWWDEAARVAEILADRLGDEDSVATLSGGRHPYAGLVRGSSGPALMFLRLYEHFGAPELLDLAATALRQDLRRCVINDDGTMGVNEGWRTMPYLADGSIGIGIVLDEYLAHRDDERFAEAGAAIRRITEAPFFIEPGLFWGRAGMILYRSRGLSPGTGADDAITTAHVRRLSWHALAYRGHLAFPGEELLRLSMDLATGTAGILLAAGAALHDQPVDLPLIDRPRPERGGDHFGVLLTEGRR